MKNFFIFFIAILLIGAVTFAIAQTKGGKVKIPAVVEDKGDMVKIPAGWFNMGCSPQDSKCDNDEKPSKRVYVDAFYMDVHETTVAQYRQCVSAGSCKAAIASSDKNWGAYYNWDKSGRGDHPVNGVSWSDANSYCQWKGKRLPTEAEFERALRGGFEGRKYPWGNSSTPPSPDGNYADESAKRRFSDLTTIKGYDDGYVGTAPVCRFGRNEYGLCDISGNVWEWCEDWYDKDYYSRMADKNPINHTKASNRVLRGGSWLDDPQSLRASNRDGINPTGGGNYFGFRCSRD
jgi:formylglycine-generating enzyme required for sulfatase activity